VRSFDQVDFQSNHVGRNQNAIGGPIPKDTFQDAVALEDISLYDGAWHEWPLLATDGDSAALIQLVSQDKVCLHSFVTTNNDLCMSGGIRSGHIASPICTGGS